MNETFAPKPCKQFIYGGVLPIFILNNTHNKFSLITLSLASLAAGQRLPYISAIPPLFRRGDAPLYIKPGERCILAKIINYWSPILRMDK